VLIVDRSSDVRDVLRTVLELRGVQILEATGAHQGLQMARQFHPSLIVLDLESESAEQESVQDQYAVQSQASNAPLVILGNLDRWRQQMPEDRMVAKPYHYGPLVRKIEQLLSHVGPAAS
jgi:DNA-binding response OmpR family regulator